MLSLFVSIGGVGYAASKIDTNDIKNKAVTKPKIDKQAVSTNRIGDQAVKAKKLADQAVNSDKLADQAVSTDKLADQAVSTDKIADQAVQFRNIQDLAIGTDKLSTGAVTSEKIGNGAVTSAKVDGSIVTANTVGVPIAGMNVSEAGTVRQFFNRVGGQPTVTHTATSGIYDITIPGLDGRVLNGSSVSLATIQSSGFGDGATVSSSGGNPRIRTANGAGNAVDRSFEYVVFQPSS